jgi:hypothetical protein
MLTLKIKSGDIVWIKRNPQHYAKMTMGIRKELCSKLDPGCCKDPNYVFFDSDRRMIFGEKVRIIATQIRYRHDVNSQLIGAYYYATITLCNQDKLLPGQRYTVDVPIEFIDRTCWLVREHKKICLHKKKLIVGE